MSYIGKKEIKYICPHGNQLIGALGLNSKQVIAVRGAAGQCKKCDSAAADQAALEKWERDRKNDAIAFQRGRLDAQLRCGCRKCRKARRADG